MTPIRASVITALHAVPGDLDLGVFTPDQDSHVQGLTQATHIEPLQTTQQCPSFSHLPEAVLFCTFLLVSHSEYLLSATGEVACVHIEHLSLLCLTAVGHSSKRGTVASNAHAYRAVAGGFAELHWPSGCVTSTGVVAQAGDPQSCSGMF